MRPFIGHHAWPVLHVGQHVLGAGNVIAVHPVPLPLRAPLPKIGVHPAGPHFFCMIGLLPISPDKHKLAQYKLDAIEGRLGAGV